MGEVVAVNPWMSEDLLHGVPLRGLILEHASDKVFQLGTEVSSFFKYLPVDVRPVGGDQTVVFILANCFFEWHTLSNHGEEHDSGSEHVSTLSSIRVENVLLWGHVTESSQVFVKHIRSVISRKFGGKTKVSNFEIKIFVN